MISIVGDPESAYLVNFVWGYLGPRSGEIHPFTDLPNLPLPGERPP